MLNNPLWEEKKYLGKEVVVKVLCDVGNCYSASNYQTPGTS